MPVSTEDPSPSGAARAPSARLFTALWPPEPVRAAIARHAERWSWPRGARRVRADKLHLTLHFLGEVPLDRVPPLAQALAVPFEPFDLQLAHGQVWPGGIAVFGPAAVPPALLDLHARLGAALADFGRPPEQRPLRAHVTLARQAQGAVRPLAGEAIDWRVSRYVLVESERRPPAGYRVIASWPPEAAGGG